jgi:preprotein translocase subunit YajC
MSIPGMLLFLILGLGFPVALFFIIKYFIRYNAQQNRGKTQEQEEINKMKIDDL